MDLNYCTSKTKMSMQLENMKLKIHPRSVSGESRWEVIANESKARTTIGLCLEGNQLKHTHGCNTAREVWKVLESEHDHFHQCPLSTTAVIVQHQVAVRYYRSVHWLNARYSVILLDLRKKLAIASLHVVFFYQDYQIPGPHLLRP